jgi:hypothetical protein
MYVYYINIYIYIYLFIIYIWYNIYILLHIIYIYRCKCFRCSLQTGAGCIRISVAYIKQPCIWVVQSAFLMFRSSCQKSLLFSWWKPPILDGWITILDGIWSLNHVKSQPHHQLLVKKKTSCYSQGPGVATIGHG